MEELNGMSTEDLLERLHQAEAELEDVEQISQGILGGTGMHIGARLMRRARYLYEDKGAELRQQIAELKKLLGERGVKL